MDVRNDLTRHPGSILVLWPALLAVRQIVLSAVKGRIRVLSVSTMLGSKQRQTFRIPHTVSRLLIGRLMRVTLILLLLATLGLPTDPVWSLEVDTMLDHELRFEPQPRVNRFFPELRTLWIEAMKRPEAELKRQAAMAIIRAHRDGMTGLQDTVPLLVELLQEDPLHPVVELSVVQALIELDARETAALLMERASQNVDLPPIVEPVLARWDHKPMRARWKKRIADDVTSGPMFILAIESLETVGELTAAGQLEKWALDPKTPADQRLKAARATGRLQRQGLEAPARTLIGDESSTSLVDRLVAALLLRHHSGSVASELLLSLAVDREGAVGTLALERLKELDPALVTDINEQLVASPDASVRRLTAECLFGQATPDSVALLGNLLDDPIPSNRILAGDLLARMDENEELSNAVRQAAVRMLASDRRRGLEQAALVVGQIDHEPAADRLIELLAHAEPKVSVSAAWALRRLAVPETGPDILENVRRFTEETQKLDDELWTTWSQDPPPSVDFAGLNTVYDRTEHLLDALAVLGVAEADPLLRGYLPRPKPRQLGDPPAVAAAYQDRLRATAVITLSYIHQRQPVKEITQAFLARMEDSPAGETSDSARVRGAAAAGLARLKAVDAIPVLRRYRGALAAHEVVGAACGRALHELSGDPLPPTVPAEFYRTGWFLEPLKVNAKAVE